MYLVTHLGSNQTFTSCLLNAYHGGVFRNVLLHCDCVRCVRATYKCVRACMVQVRRLQACWYSVCLAQSSKASRHVCTCAHRIVCSGVYVAMHTCAISCHHSHAQPMLMPLVLPSSGLYRERQISGFERTVSAIKLDHALACSFVNSKRVERIKHGWRG